MRVIALLVLVALLAPTAIAQTAAIPIRGSYSQVYVISGRAIDVDGDPVAGGKLTIELDQEGLTVAPLQATANCKGDFITGFIGLVYVDPKAKAKITLEGAEGARPVSTTVPLDPFWRRSDAVVRLDSQWAGACSKEQDVWAVSASVAVRILNRTLPYPEGEHEFHARPHTGIVRLRYETPGGETICPPHPQSEDPDECETFVVDERGDMRYTFTLNQPFEAGGRIQVLLQDGSSYDIPIDHDSRIGVKYIEATGQGPVVFEDTPGFGVALLAVALAVALGLARRR